MQFTSIPMHMLPLYVPTLQNADAIDFFFVPETFSFATESLCNKKITTVGDPFPTETSARAQALVLQTYFTMHGIPDMTFEILTMDIGGYTVMFKRNSNQVSNKVSKLVFPSSKTMISTMATSFAITASILAFGAIFKLVTRKAQ